MYRLRRLHSSLHFRLDPRSGRRARGQERIRGKERRFLQALALTLTRALRSQAPRHWTDGEPALSSAPFVFHPTLNVDFEPWWPLSFGPYEHRQGHSAL